MTAEEIRKQYAWTGNDMLAVVVEIAAQLAELVQATDRLGERIADFLATEPQQVSSRDNDLYEDYKRRKENWKEYLENKEK